VHPLGVDGPEQVKQAAQFAYGLLPLDVNPRILFGMPGLLFADDLQGLLLFEDARLGGLHAGLYFAKLPCQRRLAFSQLLRNVFAFIGLLALGLQGLFQRPRLGQARGSNNRQPAGKAKKKQTVASHWGIRFGSGSRLRPGQAAHLGFDLLHHSFDARTMSA